MSNYCHRLSSLFSKQTRPDSFFGLCIKGICLNIKKYNSNAYISLQQIILSNVVCKSNMLSIFLLVGKINDFKSLSVFCVWCLERSLTLIILRHLSGYQAYTIFARSFHILGCHEFSIYIRIILLVS